MTFFDPASADFGLRITAAVLAGMLIVGMIVLVILRLTKRSERVRTIFTFIVLLIALLLSGTAVYLVSFNMVADIFETAQSQGSMQESAASEVTAAPDSSGSSQED